MTLAGGRRRRRRHRVVRGRAPRAEASSTSTDGVVLGVRLRLASPPARELQAQWESAWASASRAAEWSGGRAAWAAGPWPARSCAPGPRRSAAPEPPRPAPWRAARRLRLRSGGRAGPSGSTARRRSARCRRCPAGTTIAGASGEISCGVAGTAPDAAGTGVSTGPAGGRVTISARYGSSVAVGHGAGRLDVVDRVGDRLRHGLEPRDRRRLAQRPPASRSGARRRRIDGTVSVRRRPRPR